MDLQQNMEWIITMTLQTKHDGVRSTEPTYDQDPLSVLYTDSTTSCHASNFPENLFSINFPMDDSHYDVDNISEHTMNHT